MSFDEFCERVQHLRRDRAGGIVKPYKPLLIAAVVLLIQKRKITNPSVLLDGGLRSAFVQLLDALFPSWPYSAKAEYPFRHLENDGVWKLVPIEGASDELRAARDAKAEAWDVLRHVRCAQLDPEVFACLVRRFDARVRVLQILWETYFPPDAALKLMRFMTYGEEDRAGTRPLTANGQGFTEKALEEHLEQHWDETPFAAMGIELATRERHGFAGRQVFTPVNAIDLLGFRKQSREWWIFELKRDRPSDAVVGQVSRYLSWVAEERRSHRETTVGAIIARRADRKLLYAARANPRLSVWEFDDDLVLHPVH
jgi:hypothetical protein